MAPGLTPTQLWDNVPDRRPGRASVTDSVVRSFLVPAGPAAPPDPAVEAGAAGHRPRRRRLAELDHHLHCSIIGTCLDLAELAALARKLGLATGSPPPSDHDLHSQVVVRAGRSDAGGRLINKLLDRKFAAVVARFDRAGTEAEVRRSWQEARDAGDIPGAYWAAITHPATTPTLLREVFGAVHMLSHLVGAANRADIGRLQQLENERAQLSARLSAERRQSRDQLDQRDARLRALSASLAALEAERAASRASGPAMAAGERAAYEANLRDLRDRLERQAMRIAEVEARATAAEEAARQADARLGARESELAAIRNECRGLEQALAGALGAETGEPAGDAPAAERDLSARRILVVGGRDQQMPHFRRMIERRNGQFLHHDGGLEEGAERLANMLARADAVLFPVDCISHEGYRNLKRLCRRHGTPYLPMRTASLGALTDALDRVTRLEPRP